VVFDDLIGKVQSMKKTLEAEGSWPCLLPVL
jgi:hypothetical protein